MKFYTVTANLTGCPQTYTFATEDEAKTFYTDCDRVDWVQEVEVDSNDPRAYEAEANIEYTQQILNN